MIPSGFSQTQCREGCSNRGGDAGRPPPARSLPSPAEHQKRQMKPILTQQPGNPPARSVMHPLGPSWAASRHRPLTPSVLSYRCETAPRQEAGRSGQEREVKHLCHSRPKSNEGPPGPTTTAEPALPVSRARPHQNPLCRLLFSGSCSRRQGAAGGADRR